MGSTFSTYNIAYSGMYTNQAALAAVSNNLSNVSTSGASRTRVAAAEQSIVIAGQTSVGTGTSVQSITRARDQLLDNTYRTQNADANYWAVKSGDLEYMQEILNEFESDDGTSGTGLQATIEDFFSAWEELAKDPSAQSNRQAVTEAASSLISALSEIDSQLQQLQVDAVAGVKDGVASLNDLAGQVADLNKQISVAEAGGGEASYLRDQRDSLLDQMSSLAGISTVESNGVLQVTLGGVNLVTGSTAHTLTVEGDGSTEHPLVVKWDDNLDCTNSITSGSIKAYLEDADQTGYSAIDTTSDYNFTTTATSSISTLRQGLNDLITTLAAQINALHSAGTDLDGEQGLDFFTVIDDSQPLSITNIQVNPTLVDDPDKLVAAASSSSGDNTIATAISDLSSTSCYKLDGLSLDINNFYAGVISWIGTAGDTAASSYATQTALVTQVENQRQSISGISTDEEMSNMIMYQNAYAASARVLSTVDGLIAGLIEDLG